MKTPKIETPKKISYCPICKNEQEVVVTYFMNTKQCARCQCILENKNHWNLSLPRKSQ